MQRLRRFVKPTAINKTGIWFFVSLITAPITVWATPDTQNFDTHCKHCHNKSAEKTVAESVIKVDGVLHTKNSEIPLTEFLNSHYLVLQTEQVQALVDELTRVSDELSLD